MSSYSELIEYYTKVGIKIEKFDENIELKISAIVNLQKKIIEYKKYFKETGKQSDFDLVKNVELVITIYKELTRISSNYKDDEVKSLRILITLSDINNILSQLIYYCNNIDEKVVESVLNIIAKNKFDHLINPRFYDLFGKYFKDVDILKHLINFTIETETFKTNYDINTYICTQLISETLKNICNYKESIINDKIEEYTKIICNLDILKCYDIICKIADFLCERKAYFNNQKLKLEYEFTSKLHNYIFYEMNLLNTIVYNDNLQKILDKYK